MLCLQFVSAQVWPRSSCLYCAAFWNIRYYHRFHMFLLFIFLILKQHFISPPFANIKNIFKVSWFAVSSSNSHRKGIVTQIVCWVTAEVHGGTGSDWHEGLEHMLISPPKPQFSCYVSYRSYSIRPWLISPRSLRTKFFRWTDHSRCTGCTHATEQDLTATGLQCGCIISTTFNSPHIILLLTVHYPLTNPGERQW